MAVRIASASSGALSQGENPRRLWRRETRLLSELEAGYTLRPATKLRSTRAFEGGVTRALDATFGKLGGRASNHGVTGSLRGSHR